MKDFTPMYVERECKKCANYYKGLCWEINCDVDEFGKVLFEQRTFWNKHKHFINWLKWYIHKIKEKYKWR